MGGPNFASRTLFHGDNLDFLRGMNSSTVHLIATDPPFNKGRDFHATPDSLAAGARFQDRWSWADDVEGEWIDQIQDDWPAVWEVIDAARAAWGDDMAAFLCFMGVRLIEMRRVLRDDGSLYLHCDPTASHYLKALLDAVFGRRNFVNEIIWHYRKWAAGKYTFQRNHDIILFYANSQTRTRTFNQLYMPRAASTVRRFGSAKIVSGHNAHGQRVPSTMAGESDGVRQDDVWDFNRVAPIKQMYPTEKPIPLYERMILASSNDGDLVLDPFCGCATTLVAAERLGRQWIGADIWEGAADIVRQRMADNRQLLTDADPQVHYTTEPPVRTDDGGEAVPFLQVTERYAEPGGQRMSRAAMYDHLLTQHGPKCQGCDRTFDDPRYLELDHNTPRSDGGMNHITNRILLCGPCNRLKSNQYTLSGLRRQNQRLGYMAR